MTKFELITKQPIRDIFSKLNHNEMFYKYSYMNNFVWFTQHIDSGNIYSVSVQLDPDLTKYFKCWTNTSEPDYYPNNESVRFEIMSNELLKPDSFDQLVCYVEFAKELRESIVEIFNLPEHKLLWEFYHAREDKEFYDDLKLEQKEQM